MANKEASNSNHHTTPIQDVSGTLSIIVETILVLENILPIVVALKVKKFKDRVVTDELIVALSITDILSVLVPTPLALISYFNKSWYGGRETCVFYQLTMLWFQVVSILIVSYMCIDRFMAVRMALYYKMRGLYSADKVKYFVLFIFGFSLAIVSLPLMGLAPPVMSESFNVCESWLTSMPRSSKQSIFYIALLSVGYLNMFIVGVANISVTSLLWKLKRKMQPRAERQPPDIMELQMDRKAIFQFTWMVIVLAGIFYLTWFPTLVMITLQKAGLLISDVAILYALLCTTLTGLLNPLIYGLFSKSYRSGYRQIISDLFSCICRCNPKELDAVAAIARDTNMDNDTCMGPSTNSRKTKTRSYLKKSKSFHDKPLRGGFYNHALDTSVHSGLSDLGAKRFNQRHSYGSKPNRCRKRARSLTPTRSGNGYAIVECEQSTQDRSIHSSSSSLGSSAVSDIADVSSDDMNEGDEDEEVASVSVITSVTLETAI